LLQRTGTGPWLAREAAITPEEKLVPDRTPPDPTALAPVPPAAPDPVKTWTYELTFDDGPHIAALGKGLNRTEKVLDTLKARGIKAGFFIQTGVSHRGASEVGRALVKRMHDEGHTVGIHTGGKKDHELHTTAQKNRRLKGELRSAKDYIEKITGEEPRYVRPPTGAFNPAVSATYARVGLENCCGTSTATRARIWTSPRSSAGSAPSSRRSTSSASSGCPTATRSTCCTTTSSRAPPTTSARSSTTSSPPRKRSCLRPCRR